RHSWHLAGAHQFAAARIVVLRLPRFEPPDDIRDRILIEDPVEVARDVSDMRRRNHGVELPQRMISRERLDIENVYGGAGDVPIAERIDEGGLVNDRSSGGIHEPGRWFHQAQLGLPHQTSCSATQYQVDG